jgi:hypothetical protein
VGEEDFPLRKNKADVLDNIKKWQGYFD